MTTIRNRALEETPNRVLTFLRAVGLSADIRRVLKDAGYTDGVHQQGWALLARTSGFDHDVTTLSPVADAIRSLSEWANSGFHRVRAALTHMHPEQAEYVFKGLEPATGVAAVMSVQLLLDRSRDAESKNPARSAHNPPL